MNGNIPNLRTVSDDTLKHMKSWKMLHHSDRINNSGMKEKGMNWALIFCLFGWPDKPEANSVR